MNKCILLLPESVFSDLLAGTAQQILRTWGDAEWMRAFIERLVRRNKDNILIVREWMARYGKQFVLYRVTLTYSKLYRPDPRKVGLAKHLYSSSYEVFYDMVKYMESLTVPPWHYSFSGMPVQWGLPLRWQSAESIESQSVHSEKCQDCQINLNLVRGADIITEYKSWYKDKECMADSPLKIDFTRCGPLTNMPRCKVYDVEMDASFDEGDE